MAFFPRGQLTLLSLFPARPASRRPSRAPQLLGPAAAPAQQAAPGNRPRPRAQTLTARARLSAPSSPRAPRNRPARPHAATAPTPRRGSVPPSRPAALNRHRAVSAPPCCPALVSALAVHRGRPQPSPRDLRAPSTAPPRGQPPPSRLRLHFPLGELRRPPLYLPVSLFLVFVGFPSLGRELRGPWSPAMAATALAPVSGRRNGMAATPFSPRAHGCPRWSIW